MTGPAYRTISDVAAMVGVPQHVLRFWETKFPQIAPLKRGGNRRYYRSEDIAAIERISRLLHDEGYTIKGAQKLLAGGDAAGEHPAVPGAAGPERGGRAVDSTGARGALPAGQPQRARIAEIRADLAAALAAARAM